MSYCYALVYCQMAISKGKHEYIFTTGSFEEDKKRKEEKANEEIDFAALARSN